MSGEGEREGGAESAIEREGGGGLAIEREGGGEPAIEREGGGELAIDAEDARETPERTHARSVLITGARGAIGRELVRALAAAPRGVERIVALDVRDTPQGERLGDVIYETLDVQSPELAGVVARHGVDTVVHLAAVVTPGPGMTREQLYAIDVGGTRNVLAACLHGGVSQLVVTSSGAAYGYHADAPPLYEEDHVLGGNPEFAYSDHKRLVEEMLAEHRAAHPELGQLVLRLCTVLGEQIDNQITAMFFRPVVIGVEGSPSPFVFVWIDDVVDAILRGVHERRTGVYNVAGDGVLTLREIADLVGRPYLALPAPLLTAAIAELGRRGRTQYGPEQVVFLRYRPVLGNARLKRELGLRPLSSREALLRYLQAAERRRAAAGGGNGAGRGGDERMPARLGHAIAARLGRNDRLARTALGVAQRAITRLAPAITRWLGGGGAPETHDA